VDLTRYVHSRIANSRAAYAIAIVFAAAAVPLKYGLERGLPALSGAEVDLFSSFRL